MCTKHHGHCYNQSQEVEVVQFVPVLHDVPLDLGRVDPGDEILHVPVVETLASCTRHSMLDGKEVAGGDKSVVRKTRLVIIV